MMTDLTSSFLQAQRRGGVCLLVLLGLAGFASSPAVRAGVTSGDVFSVEAVGFNQADPGDNTYLIYPTTLDPTFGKSESFANSAEDGQTVSVISTEATSAGITTDTFIVSVPDNFVPTGTLDNGGNPIDAIDFSIGDYYGGTDTVNFTNAPVAPVVTGSATFVEGGLTTAIGLAQSPVFSNGGTSFSDAEGITSYMANYPISNYDPTSFTFSISYTAVPEPSSVALMLCGGAGLVWVALRRRQVGLGV